ncbi:MAG: hypothetical protein ACM336_08720 [Acidobacteriota bacterium]
MPKQASPNGQPAAETPAKSPRQNLTKEQQDATVRKWADWILKQRQSAAEGKSSE